MRSESDWLRKSASHTASRHTRDIPLWRGQAAASAPLLPFVSMNPSSFGLPSPIALLFIASYAHFTVTLHTNLYIQIVFIHYLSKKLSWKFASCIFRHTHTTKRRLWPLNLKKDLISSLDQEMKYISCLQELPGTLSWQKVISLGEEYYHTHLQSCQHSWQCANGKQRHQKIVQP